MAEEVVKPRLPYKMLKAWIKDLCAYFGYSPGDLTYIFCSDIYLKDINFKFLNHDYFTDIVTFDYSSNKVLSGDMFISMDRVKDNSDFFKATLTDEYCRVIVHGLLHLLGYNDRTEEEKVVMRDLEDDCILRYKKLADENT